MAEGRDAKGIKALDAALAPPLTPEQEAAEREARMAALEETWGMSPEAEAGAAKMDEWAAAMGG